MAKKNLPNESNNGHIGRKSKHDEQSPKKADISMEEEEVDEPE